MKTVTRKVGKVDKIRAAAVNKTARDLEYDPSTVRKVANGDRKNEEVKKYYQKTYKAIKKVLTA